MEIRINPADFLFEEDFETIKEEPMENSEQEDPTSSPIIAKFIVLQRCGPQTLITQTIPKPPMMWNTNTSFIDHMIQFGVSESGVIALMRKELKRSSFNLWRKRINSGISQKHLQIRIEKTLQNFLRIK